MIKRINFIQKRGFVFTYQKLFMICLGVIALNLLFSGYQMAKVYLNNASIIAKKIVVKKLEVQREQLLKKPLQSRVSIGEHQELIDKVQGSTKWSLLLSEMTQSLPNAVQITNFKSISRQIPNVTDTKTKKKAEKKAEETIATFINALEISGLGREMRHITEFAINLAKSSHFKNPTLTDSAQEEYGFTFTIKSEVLNDQ